MAAPQTIEEIEAAIRRARFEESPIERMEGVRVKTRMAAFEQGKKTRDAFWAGYGRGRIDHAAGAFGHAAVYVWAAAIAGMVFGFLTAFPFQ